MRKARQGVAVQPASGLGVADLRAMLGFATVPSAVLEVSPGIHRAICALPEQPVSLAVSRGLGPGSPGFKSSFVQMSFFQGPSLSSVPRDFQTREKCWQD